MLMRFSLACFFWVLTQVFDSPQTLGWSFDPSILRLRSRRSGLFGLPRRGNEELRTKNLEPGTWNLEPET